VSEANVVEIKEDVWVTNVAECFTKGIYRGVKVAAYQVNDELWDLYLDDNFHSSLKLRSPVKAIAAAKAAVDRIREQESV
jgi:hypothetical protein